MTWLLWLVLALVAPLHGATPGVAREITLKELCATKWGRDARHVTPAMRHQVFAAYGIPYSHHAQYELDHLIPRELGGADDVRNLWPELWADAHRKDHEENRLHQAVCAGTVTLADAQDQMRRWNR